MEQKEVRKIAFNFGVLYPGGRVVWNQDLENKLRNTYNHAQSDENSIGIVTCEADFTTGDMVTTGIQIFYFGSQYSKDKALHIAQSLDFPASEIKKITKSDAEYFFLHKDRQTVVPQTNTNEYPLFSIKALENVYIWQAKP